MNRREFLSKILPKNPSENAEILNSRISANNEHKLQINTANCLAWQGVICNNCADVCALRAIEFLGLFRPRINERCNSCDECITSCFKGAINVI